MNTPTMVTKKTVADCTRCENDYFFEDTGLRICRQCVEDIWRHGKYSDESNDGIIYYGMPDEAEEAVQEAHRHRVWVSNIIHVIAMFVIAVMLYASMDAAWNLYSVYYKPYRVYLDGENYVDVYSPEDFRLVIDGKELRPSDAGYADAMEEARYRIMIDHAKKRIDILEQNIIEGEQ